MNSFNLVFANDGVLKSTAIFDQEDSIRITALVLASALNTTAISLHATVKGAGNLLGLLVGDGALGGRDWDGSAFLETEGLDGRGGGRAGGDGGHEGGDGSSDGNGELHLDGLKG